MQLPDPTVVVDRLEPALATTGRLVEAVTPGQWGVPTPCPGWDVRALTNHLVGGLRIFAAQLTGCDAGGEHEDDWLGDDPAAAHRDAAGAVLAAWRSPGATARTLSISLGPVPAPLGAVIELTEVLVHGLDLAVATGRLHDTDAAQADWLLTLMIGMGFDAFRLPGVFGSVVPVPASAPAQLRLLGFLGREVSAAAALPA